MPLRPLHELMIPVFYPMRLSAVSLDVLAAARGDAAGIAARQTKRLARVVQTAQAMAVQDALDSLRRDAPRPLLRWLDPLYLGERIAFVGARGLDRRRDPERCAAPTHRTGTGLHRP